MSLAGPQLPQLPVDPLPPAALLLLGHRLWVMGGQTGAPAQSEFVKDLAAGKAPPPAPPPLRDVWRSDDGAE